MQRAVDSTACKVATLSRLWAPDPLRRVRAAQKLGSRERTHPRQSRPLCRARPGLVAVVRPLTIIMSADQFQDWLCCALLGNPL